MRSTGMSIGTVYGPSFPFICLLVSGGNSQIIKVDAYDRMEVVGQTIDDAAGEAFDKCAKVMGLGYPGGPVVNRLANEGEVNLLLAIQTFQEAIHSQSYQYIIESILPKQSRDLIYDKWRDDNILFERNSFIAKIYQDFIDNESDENFAKVLIANYLLESLYFYNGFNFFYLLASRNKMVGTSDIIRLINRDELSHVVLFRYMVKEIKNEYPNFFSAEIIYEMFKTAVEQEISWTEHIIGNRVLGITSQTTEAYTKWLANERLKSLGLEPIFTGFNKNPYKHLERFADTEGEGNVKSNFFEGTVTSYNMSTSIDGWEDF